MSTAGDGILAGRVLAGWDRCSHPIQGELQQEKNNLAATGR